MHRPHTKCNTVKPLFIVFVWGLKKKQWIWENNSCGSNGLNRIRSGTIEIERRIRESKLHNQSQFTAGGKTDNKIK
jgi:hypothetical protein